MAYKINDNTNVIDTRVKTNVPLALRFMLNDIKRESTPVTPKLSGDLRRNVTIRVSRKSGRIKWNQHYAEYQERGYTSGPVRRYTTPGTGKRFAFNSVRKVTRNALRYFRRARV